jgi:GT2 family glycosyltransferase
VPLKVQRDLLGDALVVRFVVVCDAGDEPVAMAEARQRFDRSADRIVVLSPRRGDFAVGTDRVLSVPVRFALKDAGLPNWRRRNRVRKAIAIGAGLQSARFFANIEDLLVNIEACDPDTIDLRRLGGFGRWLRARCARRLPGRRVITDTDGYGHDENIADWRSYDPTVVVSIVLPVYNGQKYLSLSIESCLAQTHQNLELIIVDDGSLDDTPTIVEKYALADRRIKVIRNQKNLGLPESLNLGFELSQGDFLTWTSDDNLYADTAIEYMVQQLCTFTEIGLVYCGVQHIDETGNKITYQLPYPPTAMTRECTVTACFMYRRDVMDAVGPYRPAYRYVEDWDFFIRACLQFPSKFCYEMCYFYRHHGSSLTSAHRDKWKILGAKLYREHFGSGRKQILVPTLQQVMPNGRN